LFSQTFSPSLYLIAGSVRLCECFLHISVGAHFGLQVFKTSSVFLMLNLVFSYSIGQLFFTHVVLQGTPPCAVSVKIAILTTTVPLQVIATLAFAGQQPLSDIEPQGVA